MTTMSQVIDLTQDSQETIDLTRSPDVEVHHQVTSILLTYPRVKDQMVRNSVELKEDGSVEYIVDDQLCRAGSIKDFFLCSLLQVDPQPVCIIVALEKHRDGNEHIHCFVQWIDKRSFPATYFDIQGIHPNVVMLNHAGKGRNYCRKEDKQYLQWVKCFDLECDEEGFFSQLPPPYSE